MKIKLLYTCLLLAGTMGTALAQDTPDPIMTQRIREEGMNRSQVMDIAFHLTDASGSQLRYAHTTATRIIHLLS